jgi:hypothetical protein
MSAIPASREHGRERQARPPRSLKNTANPAIFAPNCAVSKGSEMTLGNIDENRSLPYKPRQLSAMPGLTGAAHLGRKRSMFGASI